MKLNSQFNTLLIETVTHARELGWKGDERRGWREGGMKGVYEEPLLLLTKALRSACNCQRERNKNAQSLSYARLFQGARPYM